MLSNYKNKIHAVLASNSLLLQNISYISLLQIFNLVAPLITYPYLVRVLGKELYGYVLTAQVLTSYFALIIDFGSNNVCAKHVSIHRNNKAKLSEVICSVLIVRFFLFLIGFLVYFAIVKIVPIYNEYALLFIISYGMNFNDLLFPQFFFQGLEKMKYTTLLNILVKLVFIFLIFLFVNSQSDAVYVPLFYAIGYALAGIISLYVIFRRWEVSIKIPDRQNIWYYVKDASPVFATDLICTIKDKLNVLLLGSFSGMSNVVVYDLGTKINSIIVKPTEILRTALFPRSAKERNINKILKIVRFTFLMSVIIVLITNIFLAQIVEFFLNDQIDLLPIRIFTIAPIILSISTMISSNMFVALGYNKYVLYSIIITTLSYLLALIYVYFNHFMTSIYSFVLIAMVSYVVELLYRLWAAHRVMMKETTLNNSEK